MKKHALLLSAALSLALFPGCRPDDEIAAECVRLSGTADANLAKVQAFVDSAIAFRDAARNLARDVEDTCRAMATDLDVTIPPLATCMVDADCDAGVRCVDISATTDMGTCGTASENACGAVVAAIEAIIRDASVTLAIDYEPPVCSVAVDAYASCAAACDVDITPAEIACEAGRLVGQCSGMCTGECRVEGSATCEGVCNAACTGTCSGTCVGACDGTCSAMDGDGTCRGTCEGTCTGECTATCTGSCSGTCTADVTGSCTGECAGSCDVDFVAPRCEVIMEGMVDVDCRAACEARVSVEAECTEPRLTITVDVDPATQPRLAALLGTLYANYPRFVALIEQLGRVVEAGAEFVDAAEGVNDAARALGLTAQLCALDALNAVLAAQASVNVSVSVTVEVSASVGD